MPRAANLPANLPSNPTYRKVNPGRCADPDPGPDVGSVYDAARCTTRPRPILAQKLSQVQGVGQVFVGGSSLPAVRVEVNPTALEQLRHLAWRTCAPRSRLPNANRPRAQFADDRRTWRSAPPTSSSRPPSTSRSSSATTTARRVRLADVANVIDSVEDVRDRRLVNGKPSVLLIIFRQPGANIIDTVDRVLALLPSLQASIPPTINLDVAMDRTTTIRASVRDVRDHAADLHRAW